MKQNVPKSRATAGSDQYLRRDLTSMSHVLSGPVTDYITWRERFRKKKRKIIGTKVNVIHSTYIWMYILMHVSRAGNHRHVLNRNVWCYLLRWSFLQASAVLQGTFSGGDMDEVTAWLFSQDKQLFVHIIFSSVQLFTQLLHSLCVK